MGSCLSVMRLTFLLLESQACYLSVCVLVCVCFSAWQCGRKENSNKPTLVHAGARISTRCGPAQCRVPFSKVLHTFNSDCFNFCISPQQNNYWCDGGSPLRFHREWRSTLCFRAALVCLCVVNIIKIWMPSTCIVCRFVFKSWVGWEPNFVHLNWSIMGLGVNFKIRLENDSLFI